MEKTLESQPVWSIKPVDPASKTTMTMEKPTNLKMYFLLKKMVIFHV